MRREFILILLGIISVSTLSSLLSSYVQIDTDKLLLDTVVGVVGAGNFSYWQLGHTGPLLIELTSLSGDADIYVSDSIRPSYEVDKNNFSSATCGPDLVNIPPEFPRPIGIGVFGDWSHSLSEYSIQVFLDTAEMQLLTTDFHHSAFDKTDQVQDFLNAIVRKDSPRLFLIPPYLDNNHQRKEKPVHKKVEEDRPRFFLKVLNILEMIFEMAIL